MGFLVTMGCVACGGSGSHANQPKAPAAKPDPYWDWHKSQPKSPAEPVRTTRFEPPQQCGQGPYRFTVETLSAPFAESVHVTLCVTHELKGSVSYTVNGYAKSERGFGSTQDAHHDRCRVDAATVVATTTDKASGGGKPGKPGARGKAAGGSKAAPVPVALTGAVVATGSACPTGMHTISITNSSFTVGDRGSGPPLKPGPFVFELWSALPNDLLGASILVEQRGVPAGYKAEDWIAYRKAWDAWYARHDAALAESRALGHQWRTVEQAAVTAQPPPPRAESQPPRPSQNARWIPGYWQFTDGWVWSAGFWRVPPEDVEQERTVEAPAPPPERRAEAPTDVAYHAARKAVWTPGHWMWNGRSYTWIAGSWRIPEAAGMTWVAPVWRPTRRGTMRFVPGGFVRLRVGR